MTTRRNFFIRALSALAVDITVGIALASACTWVIEVAALGMFLSFLLWLLTIVLSLALSQHVVHPVVKTLLSDSDKSLHMAYGAWGTKKMYGKEVEGTIRSTFLVDKHGRVAAAWPSVKVKGHVDAVLAEVAKLG